MGTSADEFLYYTGIFVLASVAGSLCLLFVATAMKAADEIRNDLK